MILRRTLHQACKEDLVPFSLIDFELRPRTAHVNDNASQTPKRKVSASGSPKNYRKAAKRSRSNSITTIRKLASQRGDDAPFPFFDLPREIRDQIYSYLVVRQDTSPRPILNASSIQKHRKRRTAAQNGRSRLNVKRVSSGKPPIRERTSDVKPLLYLDFLSASQKLKIEASEMLYSSNWFAITLLHLPAISAETPTGWDVSRITRLQIELQLKDATRMDRYVDWTALFATYSSIRFLHIVPTFHTRYVDWAEHELQTWDTAHYVHRAFFRDLLIAIPNHVDLRLGPSCSGGTHDQFLGKPVNKTLLRDMYSDLKANWRRPSTLLKVEQVLH